MKKLLRLNFIKTERQKLGITQQAFAEKSGLSLRTIQRVESDNNPPKGYTLKMLSEILEISPAVLLEKCLPLEKDDDSTRVTLSLINISVLAFFIFPFGNVFLPIIIWIRNRNSSLVDNVGRRIINFQINWTILMGIAICISPFVNIPVSFPLIFVTLGVAIIINLVVIIRTAVHIKNDKFDFLELPIKFI